MMASQAILATSEYSPSTGGGATAKSSLNAGRPLMIMDLPRNLSPF